MRSITSGSASIFAPKIKRIRKLHSPNVTLNLTLGIQQLISSTRKEELTIASSLQEDAVPVE
jgi:hypothetical protein